MKAKRLALTLIAIVPGSIMAVFCGYLFIADLVTYFAASVSLKSLPSSLSSSLPMRSDSAIPGEMVSAASTILTQALGTLLRLNCLLSGAGMMLGLILCSLGVLGLGVLSNRDIDTLPREQASTL